MGLKRKGSAKNYLRAAFFNAEFKKKELWESFLMLKFYRICRKQLYGWLRGTAVERRSLAGELSLSCARPVVEQKEVKVKERV